MITIEDFSKLDLRIGKIIKAEKVTGSEKLLKLIIDVGKEKRQILSGIAQEYSKEELVGKEVVLILNLKPKKMMGLESQGMVLMAEEDNRAIFLIPEREVKPGAKIC